LLERTVEHKVIGIIIYVHNVDESALTIFQDKTGKVIMEKCHNAYLFSVKGEKNNHYKINCLLCLRYWLLCTC